MLADHEHHDAVRTTIRGARLGLSGHAWFETFSVLTRLPPPARRAAAELVPALEKNFPASRFLPADAARHLSRRLETLGVAGGSVYDALVGATAVAHGLPLVSIDRRALPVYQALGVDLVLVG